MQHAEPFWRPERRTLMLRRATLTILGAFVLGACTGSGESIATDPSPTSPSRLSTAPSSSTTSASTTSSSTTTSTTTAVSLLRPVTPPPPNDCGPDVVCTAGWLVDPTPLEPSLGLPIDDFRHAVAALGVITRVVEWDGVPIPGQIAQDPPEAPYTEVRQEGGIVVGFVDVPLSLEEASGPTELVYVLHRILPMEESQFNRLADELGFTTRVGNRSVTLDNGRVQTEHFDAAPVGERSPWGLTLDVDDGIVEQISEAG